MTTAVTLDVRKLLEQLSHRKASGCLTLNKEFVFWKVYLNEGNVRHVECSVQDLDQFKYYLHYFELKPAVAALKNLPKFSNKVEKHGIVPSFYGQAISWLLLEKHLDLSQAVKLVEYINQDTLRVCLWLDQGTSTWVLGDSLLPPWVSEQFQSTVSLNVPEFIKSEQFILEQWQKCSEELLSVHQRPYFAPSWEQKPLPTSGSLDQKILTELSQLLKGQTSIRQLSILLRNEELNVGKILSPYIDSKIIHLHHAPTHLDNLPTIPRLDDTSSQSSIEDTIADSSAHARIADIKSKTWKIVCIDDSPTILGEIQRFLGQEKFKVTAIDDPVQAVSKIFTINPDLILLDITMPRINGYKLCGLLRSSGKCDQIPIIMVTGNTGLIDKARAKISGATDYFTKPFTKEGLNRIVAKHLT